MNNACIQSIYSKKKGNNTYWYLARHYLQHIWPHLHLPSVAVCSALDIQYCLWLVLQTSVGHQAAGPQDPVSTGVGGHAGPAGEFRSEPGSVVSCLGSHFAAVLFVLKFFAPLILQDMYICLHFGTHFLIWRCLADFIKSFLCGSKNPYASNRKSEVFCRWRWVFSGIYSINSNNK